MVRTVVLGAVSAIAMFSAANAADMYSGPAGTGGYKDGPYIPGPLWTGFYVGVNGGYGFGNDKTTDFIYTVTPPGNAYHYKYLKPEAEGGFGGGQIGYNFQSGKLVYGIEADIQGSAISGEDKGVNPLNDWDTLSMKTSLNWFGTVRGRLGYSFDRMLVYATGGLAYGEIENKIGYTSLWPINCCNPDLGPPSVVKGKKSAVETGYAVGGGFEYAVTPAISLKAEYLYIDLGETRVNATEVYNGTVTGVAFHAESDNTFHTVKVGVNYHVGSTYEPLK